jgi:hypothetical protein
MERPNAWAPLPEDLLIFLSSASASASANRGSSVQLRWRESDWGDGATAWALSVASLVRWSARVATEGDSDGDFLLLILLSEEEGQMLRPSTIVVEMTNQESPRFYPVIAVFLLFLSPQSAAAEAQPTVVSKLH